jgi:two-component system, OmpR family, sensor kinase
MKLRSRLAVAAGIVVAVLAIIGFLLPRLVRSALLDQADGQLAAAFPIALSQFARGPGSPGPEPPSPAASPTPFSDLYIAEINGDGTIRELVTSRLAVGRRPVIPEGADNATAVPPSSRLPQAAMATVRSADGAGRWRAAVLLVPGGDRHLLFAVPMDRIDATVGRLRWFLVAAALVVAGAIGLAAWWIIRLGLRPIADVTAVADAIAAGERDRRANESSTGTEAAILAHSLNAMLDERTATEDRLRRFVADASHELRTPVAAIRGFTDLHRNRVLSDPDSLEQAMRRIGQEAARMGGLVEDLLLLASLDQGRPLERALVNVSNILGDAVLDASATHPSRSVTALSEPALVVQGDESRLRQVVANLVTNALVHAGSEATVTLVARQTAEGRCVIEVVDDGDGMDAAAAAHAFDRFWRGASSRVRGGSGAGLGLSIVQAIVEAHGGSMALETAPGEGTRVTVVVPT